MPLQHVDLSKCMLRSTKSTLLEGEKKTREICKRSECFYEVKRDIKFYLKLQRLILHIIPL